MYEHGMIAPVVVLAAWSLLMLIWLYLTRIPAMSQAKIRPGQATKAQMDGLPAWARNPSDNYNHLMEQPTIFYAIAISLSLLSVNSDASVLLAWVYVVLRVAHSLLQALVNKIEVRFAIFVLSNIPLFALTYIAAREYLFRIGSA